LDDWDDPGFYFVIVCGALFIGLLVYFIYFSAIWTFLFVRLVWVLGEVIFWVVLFDLRMDD